MARGDLPDTYAHALRLEHIYIRQIPPGHGITITYSNATHSIGHHSGRASEMVKIFHQTITWVGST